MTRTDVSTSDCVLLLRSNRAVSSYLDGYPALPKASTEAVWADAAGWAAEGQDADENTFKVALHWGVPILRMEELAPDPDAIAQITPELARRLRMVPLRASKGLLAVAMEDASDTQAIDQLNFRLSLRVVPIAATPRAIREGIANHFDRTEDAATVRLLGLDPHAEVGETTALEAERLSLEQPVVRTVGELIAGAVARRASDIHLRPGEHGTDVLYRIDDELVPVRRFMRALQPAVVSRIKVLGNMNLAEHRRPQDGRTTFTLDDGRKIDLRISILPAVFGESVVVRLLDVNEGLWNIEQLSLTQEDRERVNDVMARSHGMILATGPTGCGKSTTLYAMLMELRKQRINILTIEDPVEFHIEDIQQMQVNRAANFTFASAMRNFLRHDPDVIMVGEIRDRETAGIAVESALTGHLVLSTLHTNTAATTITRLLDLGVEPYLLRASLLAVIAQRLVRLNCRHCIDIENPSPHIRATLGVTPDEVFHIGRGCSRCEGLGMHRRQAIYEMMVVSQRIQSLIVRDAEADAIHRVAVNEGMVPITQAAVSLARTGAISLAEAWRVRSD